MTVPAASWWFSASELAALRLPGVPKTRQQVHAWAVAEGWAERATKDGTPLARRRSARGGGMEYHASLLPAEARAIIELRQMVRDTAPIAANDTGREDAEAWARYERLPTAMKEKAQARLAILLEIEQALDTGVSKVEAMKAAARAHGVARSSIANWFALVKGAAPSHRLPRLVPNYKGGRKQIEIDAEAWRILKSDYLRPEKPAFAACYNRLVEDYARPRGIELPTAKTLKARLEREERALKLAKREGREALRRTVPPQRRSVADLHAMQVVNVDGHTFDVFVQWEDGRIERPVMVGIQDVYSRKLLAHRIGETESTVLTRMAFSDLFRDHGIPVAAVLDNGRAFASKTMTGGAKTRFRFKIKDSEPTGVLTSLGIRTHWTLPYRGSSKPIERAWKELCENIAKHPALSGAYTGNKPDAKPENYRERAIPIAEFRRFVADQIAKHNARPGRRTEAARGGSFDAVFAASYEAAPIGRASPDQLRLAMLEAETRLCDRANGSVTLAGNRYWAEGMDELAGKRVTVRCDPDNLHSEVHVYLEDGRYFGSAPVIEATGFFDKAGAKHRSKLEANARRKARAAEEAANLLHKDRLAELLSGPHTPAPKPVPGAARLVRHRQTAAALKPTQQAVHVPAEPAFSDDFMAGVNRLRVV